MIESNSLAFDVEEIEVSPEMVKAGLYELREHSYGDDIAYVLECVYRAMEYARRDSPEYR